MNRAQTIGRQVGACVALIAMCLLVTVPLCAAAQVDSAISQGFIAKQDLPVGALVSFTQDAKDGTVEASHTENATRLVGVVSKTALVELSSGESEVQVATSGSSLALISDINGEVKRGDKIAASPVAGIGMKATESTQVLGTVAENFSAAQQVSERQVTTTTGESRTIKVGLLTTQVNVAFFQKPDESDSILPAFLLRFASNLVGRDVAPLRVLIALVLLSAGFGGVAVLLYSSVRSSIISIGRNPLSADAVHKGVFEIAGIAFGVLLLTLIAVYLVLVI